ncbi:MAG: hypothetical protein ACI4U9_03605 [Clostridia bacterium]
MNINAKDEIRLSLSSLDDYIKTLELKQEQIIKAIQNIATRLAEEAGKDTYKSVVIIPAEVQDNTAIAYAKSTNEVDTYKEFGTGIVGSQNPHIDEALTKSGWKYDVNKHGEKGWVYPKEDGTFGWTKGQPAQKKFYIASKKAKEQMASIAKEEFQKIK